MNRKQFILSLGASCDNWTWSWSFVNHEKRFVVFGAWDVHDEGYRCKILKPSWQIKNNGKKNGGFKQAVRHALLAQNEGYGLKTFPMVRAEGNPDTGTSKIKSFEPIAVDRIMVKENGSWYAYVSGSNTALSEGIGGPDPIFLEGRRTTHIGTAVERNSAARSACLAHHGLNCSVCNFNFEEVYGPHGIGFIHVHHLNPVAATSSEYQIDPKEDLRPVCPNCHAMLHRTGEITPMAISELQTILKSRRQS